MALLRGYLKKRVTEIQKKLSEKETWLGVLNKVQGLLRDVGEKEELTNNKGFFVRVFSG